MKTKVSNSLKIKLYLDSVVSRISNKLNPSLIPINTYSYEQKRAHLNNIIDKYRPKVAIETGTFLGDTTAFLAEKCSQVYSIELAKELANKAKKRFANSNNITIIHGDSEEHIPNLLSTVPGQKFFWLDGHFSGSVKHNNSLIHTARGSLDTPIVAELIAILNDNMPHIIMIDDARLFTGLNDYPTIKRIKKLCKDSKKEFTIYEECDIIHILPKILAA